MAANKIEAEGAQHLAKGLETNNALTSLRLVGEWLVVDLCVCVRGKGSKPSQGKAKQERGDSKGGSIDREYSTDALLSQGIIQETGSEKGCHRCMHVCVYMRSK